MIDDTTSGFGICSAPALSKCLGGSPLLRELEMVGFDLEEDHCRALATLERTDLEICFDSCSFDARDAEEAFIEWLRNSQVVTALVYCKMERCISALGGNSSVKLLQCMPKCDDQSEDQFRSLARQLPANQGIEKLHLLLLNRCPISDETWNLLFRSLWTHPRITSVRLYHDPVFDGTLVTTML
jgi:hypothetical protein